MKLSPITKKRLTKFKNIKRSYYSFWILLALLFFSAIAEMIANDKPIIVYYEGNVFFPIYKVYKGTDFGGYSILEPDYKEMVEELASPNFAIKPLFFWGYNESNQELFNYPSPPTKDNLLGTDDRGRDVLTRMIYGFRVSIVFAFMNYFFAIIFGILIGGVQGFWGGFVDLIGQRTVEIWSAMPYFFILILLGSLLQPGILILTLMSAIFSWISLSYYIRAEALRIRNEEYVVASTAMGSGRFRNLIVHIIPNALTPVVTFTPFIMAGGILTLSYLDFLGFGVQPPTASIGELIRQGQEHFESAWWLAVFPISLMVFILILFNLIGEGLRSAFDPRKSIVKSK